MKLIETDFTRELTELCNIHGKRFVSDKEGIYIIDHDGYICFMTTESEVASEKSTPKLISII